MDLKEIPTDDPNALVQVVGQAHHVVAGLAHTLLVISKTITLDSVDGAALCRDAAMGIAEMQADQADKLREAGQTAEADVRDKARAQFEHMIEELFGPEPTRMN